MQYMIYKPLRENPYRQKRSVTVRFKFMNLKQYGQLERGNLAALAKAMRVSPTYIYQLAAGTAPIATKRAVEIERCTGGVVSRRDMFPDTWKLFWPELGLLDMLG